MPIYEYRCTACAAELEKLQKMSDPPLQVCPACGEPTLVKLVSASSFRLKGGGWYETDFKTGKKKNGAGDSAGESSSGGAETDKGAAASEKTDKGADSGKSSTDKSSTDKSSTDKSTADKSSTDKSSTNKTPASAG